MQGGPQKAEELLTIKQFNTRNYNNPHVKTLDKSSDFTILTFHLTVPIPLKPNRYPNEQCSLITN